jgi:hypothetical protein
MVYGASPSRFFHGLPVHRNRLLDNRRFTFFVWGTVDGRVVGLAMIGGYAWFLRQLIRENSPESQEKRARELVQYRLNNRDTLSLLSSHSRCLGMSREFDRDQDGEKTGPVVLNAF